MKEIQRLGLQVNVAKMEAMWMGIGGRERIPKREEEAWIIPEYVATSTHLRYFGVMMDRRCETLHHFRLLYPRLRGAAMALGQLLPNLNGPSDRSRRLYAGIIASMALYGAPEWADALSRDPGSRRLLDSAQRVLNLRCTRAYRTVSTVAASVLAGAGPARNGVATSARGEGPRKKRMRRRGSRAMQGPPGKAEEEHSGRMEEKTRGKRESEEQPNSGGDSADFRKMVLASARKHDVPHGAGPEWAWLSRTVSAPYRERANPDRQTIAKANDGTVRPDEIDGPLHATQGRGDGAS